MGADARIYALVPRDLDERRIREISVRLVATFGHDAFTLYLPDGYYSWGGRTTKHGAEPRHAISEVDPAEAYSDVVVSAAAAAPNHKLIEVHIHQSYYGPGYERGYWPTIVGVLRWLRHMFGPEATLFYGADDRARLFDADAERALDEHWRSSYGRAYYQRDPRAGRPGPRCAFCADLPMSSFGGGGNTEFLICQGCGVEVEWDTRTNKVTPSHQKHGRRGVEVPHEHITHALVHALAASTIGETRFVDVRHEHVAGVEHLNLTLATTWIALTQDQRAAALERAIEVLANEAKAEIAK